MASAVPFQLPTILWVAFGGAIGSVLRFAAGEAMRRIASPGASAFPWATLGINVAGSLVIGAFLRWADATDASTGVRAFVAIGICGGFTTFSTFAAENLAMLHEGQALRAALHALLSLVLTVAAAALGWWLARP